MIIFLVIIRFSHPLQLCLDHFFSSFLSKRPSCISLLQESYKMTSNEDLMQFLQRMEEKREKEKQELVGKIEDVKNEVKGTIKALTDRQDKIEVDHEQMKEDIGDLKTQMDKIRSIVENPTNHAQS